MLGHPTFQACPLSRDALAVSYLQGTSLLGISEVRSADNLRVRETRHMRTAPLLSVFPIRLFDHTALQKYRTTKTQQRETMAGRGRGRGLAAGGSDLFTEKARLSASSGRRRSVSKTPIWKPVTPSSTVSTRPPVEATSGTVPYCIACI